MMDNLYAFSIADITLIIKMINPIKITNPFTPFISDKKSNEWILNYQKVNNLDLPNGKVIYRSLDYMVIDTSKEQIRLFADRGNYGKVYAKTNIDLKNKIVTIQYLEDSKQFFSETGNCLYHSSWERIMIEEDRLLMHASCIDTKYGGILFSGPSGIGKSTQSDLWIKYEGARLINGDRPILYKDEDTWKAYGSPYAGSSKCHLNEYTNIKCIVLLKQGKVNQVRRLLANEAFKKVFRNVTVNTWDQVFMEKVLNQVMNLINEIPVYELECLPDASAIEVLKGVLEGGR